MIDNKDLLNWMERHTKEDKESFQDVNSRLDNLPDEIKTQLNGSVKDTVKAELNKFLFWSGLGGFILLVSVGVAWGTLTNQVSNNTENIKGTLDEKDYNTIQVQLSNQASVINSIQDDVKFIRDKWQ